MKAFVTGASLDIVRSLGKRGIDVYAMGTPNTHGGDSSFHSRYCKEGIMGLAPTVSSPVIDVKMAV